MTSLRVGHRRDHKRKLERREGKHKGRKARKKRVTVSRKRYVPHDWDRTPQKGQRTLQEYVKNNEEVRT